MQNVFKYGNIQNNSLTPDKELNILVHGMPSYIIMYKSYTLLVRHFWPTLYKKRDN